MCSKSQSVETVNINKKKLISSPSEIVRIELLFIYSFFVWPILFGDILIVCKRYCTIFMHGFGFWIVRPYTDYRPPSSFHHCSWLSDHTCSSMFSVNSIFIELNWINFNFQGVFAKKIEIDNQLFHSKFSFFVFFFFLSVLCFHFVCRTFNWLSELIACDKIAQTICACIVSLFS